jgi:hypothetical protein
MLRRSIKKIKHLFLTAKLAAKASSMYGAGYFNVLSRALTLCSEQQFLPDEAFRLGLFNPNVSADERRKYLSRKKLTKIQKSLNPESWAPLLKNKGLFYRYCMALDAATPKLYGIFVKGMAGWCFDSSIPHSRDDWLLFFEKKVADEFVMKPNQGAFGEGIRVFSREGGGFVDSFGKRYMAADIYSIIASDSECDSFVIQELLKNHPEIIRLTDTEHLQTVRITTVMDADARCHIIHTHFKLITGSNVTDSFHYGLTGNLQAIICPADGVLKSAVITAQEGSGIKTMDIHPKTGIALNGFRLPLWRQACVLVKETASKFLPLRTIGWDVALTPRGPVIVEGNIWWDPPNHHRRMNEIADALLQSMQ